MVENLTDKFGDFCAVNNISFSVKPGEIFGFLGANGAGKTTTIRVLCGLLIPTSGEVEVGGIKLQKGDEIAIKKDVGYMSQKFTLYDDLTVQENFSFLAKLRNLENETFVKRQKYLLDFISFKKPLNTFIYELTPGIKQQVSLAAAILHNPEVVFLDEPTAGTSPQMRARFWALIQELVKEGKTIFVTTHYMDEAEQCHRIALMHSGEILALDTPENLKKDKFPEKLYEFYPKQAINYSKIRDLRNNPEFSYFEPYGFRFHAVFNKESKSEKVENFKNELSKEFNIQETAPTIEDVFIRTIEEK